MQDDNDILKSSLSDRIKKVLDLEEELDYSKEKLELFTSYNQNGIILN